MITVKFYVKKETYEFTAESVWEAMAMCNRRVIDKLDLHPMSWAEAGRNAYTCVGGNLFD